MGTNVGIDVGRSVGVSDTETTGGRGSGSNRSRQAAPVNRTDRSTIGNFGAKVGFESRDTGSTTEDAHATMDIVNYDVRESIAAAERAAARSSNPEATFSRELSNRILGTEGMRNRYLQDADNGRATFDVTGPLTSLEQNSVLSKGSFSTDIQGSPGDGDSNYKKR